MLIQIVSKHELIMDSLAEWCKAMGLTIHNLFTKFDQQYQYIFISNFLIHKYSIAILRTKYEICIIYSTEAGNHCGYRKHIPPNTPVDAIYDVAIALACRCIDDPLGHGLWKEKDVIELIKKLDEQRELTETPSTES